MINRAKFFAGIRAPVFGGALSQDAVNGINAVLNEWERRSLTDLRWLAYMLATMRGEVGANMLPVREGFASSDAAARIYVKKQGYKYAAIVNGQVYYGRGLVQLTWEANYRKMGALLGLDLVGNPDLALRPEIASMIMFEGMIRGSFTGKKLADYFTAAKTDWIGARRIINGTDKAEQFAAWARAFHDALRKADEPASAKAEKAVADTTKLATGGAVVGIAATGANAGWGLTEWAIAIGCLLVVAGVSAGAFYWYRQRSIAPVDKTPVAPSLPDLPPAIKAPSLKARKARLAKSQKPRPARRAKKRAA